MQPNNFNGRTLKMNEMNTWSFELQLCNLRNIGIWISKVSQDSPTSTLLEVWEVFDLVFRDIEEQKLSALLLLQIHITYHQVIQCIPGTACNSCSAISIVALLLFEAPALACINCLSQSKSPGSDTYPRKLRLPRWDAMRFATLFATCSNQWKLLRKRNSKRNHNSLSKRTKNANKKCNGATLLQRIHWQWRTLRTTQVFHPFLLSHSPGSRH